MKILLAIIFFLITQRSFTQEIDYKGLPEWSWHKQDSTEYYLYTPKNMKANEKYPVVLFMHGCCGVDDHARLRNCVDPPVRMWHNFGADAQAVPTYIIAPATSRGWEQHFTALKKVMDDLIANHNGDAKRVYVCGFSMGGGGTFSIIQQYPNYFAAVITMGMSFHGDSIKVKDIPLWCNQGETDFFSKSLRKNVADIRHLNGNETDTGATWITGVNPRYSNYKNIGHVVMWNAASTQDLTGWAYSKINDGNVYPTVFFKTPTYKQTVSANENVAVNIDAHDEDGSIAKVEVFQNNKLIKSFTHEPYSINIKAEKGDNIIKAIAVDDKGKTSVAQTILKVNIQPAFQTKKLTTAQAGSFYKEKINAVGNGELVYSIQQNELPEGLLLYPDATLKGVPSKEGNYTLHILLKDEDGDATEKIFQLSIKQKNKNEVLVTNAVTSDGTAYKISKMMLHETPNFNSKDTVLTTDLEEINFSNVAGYNGLTFIKTDINDADTSVNNFLNFNIDEDATVYVAYETLDSNFHSTIPAWLKDFKKEDGQIVAQYRYYNVYSKPFSKGKVSLPSADAKANGVGTNYFVMIKKAEQ
ncbi:MAG: Ig-like domain-containing protein [Parafilimonas sp.]